MSKLEKALKDWVNNGFLNQDQAKSIYDYESAKPESSWVLSGLLILGVIIIGLGVISIIAANWSQIPDLVKLLGDFALLSAIALWITQSKVNGKLVQFEILLLFFLILCLASIGLISQIYNTGGKLYQALLFWSVITFAAALAAKHLFVPFLWTTGFLVSLMFAALDSLTLQAIFHDNYHAVFMAAPLIAAGLTIVCKNLAGEIGATQAFRIWTLLGGLIALGVAEVQLLNRSGQIAGLASFAPGYFLAVFAAFGIWQSVEYRKFQKILLYSALAIFLVPFHLPHFQIENRFVFASLSIVELGIFSIFMASIKQKRTFQLLLFFLGLRFLGLYFQALGGLAVTGAGLILSGGVVIGMAIGWNKYRKALEAWAERWAQ